MKRLTLLGCLLSTLGLVGCSMTTLSSNDFRRASSSSYALSVVQAMGVQSMEDQVDSSEATPTWSTLQSAVYRGPNADTLSPTFGLGAGVGTGLFSGIGIGLGLESSLGMAPWSTPQADNWQYSHLLTFVPTTLKAYSEPESLKLQAQWVQSLSESLTKALESQAFITILQPVDASTPGVRQWNLVNDPIGCPMPQPGGDQIICSVRLTVPTPQYLADIPAWLRTTTTGPAMVFKDIKIEFVISPTAQNTNTNMIPFQTALYQWGKTMNENSLLYVAPMPRGNWYTMPYLMQGGKLFTFTRP